MKFWRGIIISLCIASVCGPSLADDDLAQQYFEMNLEDLLKVDVTVASKSEESAAEAPSSVTVYTRKEIMNLGVRTLEELLNYVPGFQTARTDEYLQQINAPSARGRRSNATGLDILLLIDGQRLNESWTGGWAAQAAFITVENIQQVEFIRGPGSALYGSNAFLGVINVVTVKDLNEAYLGSGSFGTYEGLVHASKQTRIGTLSFFVRQNQENKGQVYGKEYGLPDVNGTVIETFDPLDSFDMHASYTSKNEKVRLNFRETHREQNNFVLIGLADNDSRQPVSEEATSINMEADLISKEKLELSFVAQYIDNERRTQVPLFPIGLAQALGITDDPREVRGGDVFDNHQYLVGFNSSMKMGKHIDLVFGSTWRKAEIDFVSFRTNIQTQLFFAGAENWPVEVFESQDSFNFSELGDPKGKAGSRDILGIYLQGKARLGEHLTATVGGRYDDYSDFGNTFNPRGALVYKRSGSVFKAMYGEAFRAPSVQEQSEISLIFVGNEDLGPEKVETMELAWIQNIKDLGMIGITWFSTDLTDGVALAPGPPDEFGFSADRPDNVLDLKLSGFELETQMALGKHLVFRANYTHLSETEENPRRSAERTWSAYLNYGHGRWNANLNAYHHGNVETTASTPDLDGFTLLNLTGSYHFSDSIDLKVNIRNLTDETYQTYTTSGALQATGLPARGRGIFAGLRWRY